MEIESLFNEKSLEIIVDRCLAWFQRGEKTPEEIKEWLKSASACSLLMKNDSIPVVLLELICQKLEIEDRTSKNYMKAAAVFYMENESKNPGLIIDCVHRHLGIEPSLLMQYFLDEMRSNSETKTYLAAKDAIPDRSIEETKKEITDSVDEALKKKIFFKGALAGLALGICLTLAIGAITGSGNHKDKNEESLPPLVSSEAESEKMTESTTETESQTEEEEIKTAAVFSKSGTVKIRIGPSKNYQTVALVYGKSRLPFRIGKTVKDDNGDNMIWTEIYIDDYLAKEQNDFEILDTGYVEEGRVYYIASQFLVNVEE